MRTCQSCGRKNALDVDFCACGEYLRWEPTNYQMSAIVPAAPEAPPMPPEPAAVEAPPVPPEPEAPAVPPQPAAAPTPPPAVPIPAPRPPSEHFVTAVRPKLSPRKPPAPAPTPPPRRREPASQPPLPPAVAPTPTAAQAPPPSAAISLSLPGDEPNAGAAPLGVAVVPGERVRVVAHVRNQGEIVDNYKLSVEGFPSEWYTVMPDTLYLVPYGSAGAYEQEVEIHLHPPRSPAAEARRWELNVAVISGAYGRQVAAAPLTLGIHPYEDYAMRVRPERASGRRRARYDVSIANNANAVIRLALAAHDGDDACRFDFERDTVELAAAETRSVRLRCLPPRQIWIGRAFEWRFELVAAAGEAGEKLLQERAQDMRARRSLKDVGGKLPKIPGVAPPKVNAPNVSIGPGGKLDVRMPNVRGPNFQGVNLRRPTLGLKALRMPDRAGVPVTADAPLLPTQAIFRQKPWLPWWLSIVAPLLLLLALMLFLLLPKNVDVPDVVGAKTVFDAEKQLIAADLQLKATQERVTKKAPPGSVLAQSPEAGESVKKGSAVTLEVAVGTKDVKVPKLAGLTLEEADRKLRARGLQKGALSVQPPDPELKIERTIPAAGDTVKEGAAIDIFYPEPKDPDDKDGPETPGPGPDAPKGDIAVPAIEPADQKGYSAVLKEAGLVPGAPQRRISEAPRGTVFATEPAVGTKLAKGTTVAMIVSAGFPRMAYDNEANILLADSATAKRITPAVAKTDKVEKDPTWSPDGATVVFTADGRLMSADLIQRERVPTPLRPASELYADPSFAPLRARSVLAVSRVNADGDRDLCFGNVGIDTFHPRCIADDSFDIGFAHWSPGGRQLLAFAVSTTKGFGIVEYRSKKAFSANPDNWGKGRFVTKRAAGKGVFDMAVSPDGKRLAAVANIDTPVPQLYLTKPDDLGLQKAEPLPIGGCKVQWLDSSILALVDLGNACKADFGKIFRIDVADPDKQSPLAPAGDNPTFKPLSIGG